MIINNNLSDNIPKQNCRDGEARDSRHKPLLFFIQLYSQGHKLHSLFALHNSDSDTQIVRSSLQ